MHTLHTILHVHAKRGFHFFGYPQQLQLTTSQGLQKSMAVFPMLPAPGLNNSASALDFYVKISSEEFAVSRTVTIFQTGIDTQISDLVSFYYRTNYSKTCSDLLALKQYPTDASVDGRVEWFSLTRNTKGARCFHWL
jgi:hypothetical protein